MGAAGDPPLAPLIKAQLDHLLAQSTLLVKVENIRSGSKTGQYADRFTLCIPYCLDFVRCDLIYNATQPFMAPDAVFSKEDGGFNPLIPFVLDANKAAAAKTCLMGWDCRDQSRLLDLVRELRDAYAEYHKRKVEELNDSRLKFELDTMLFRQGIEVYMASSVDEGEEVRFSVPLSDMDLDKLVPAKPWNCELKLYAQFAFPVTTRGYTSVSPPRIKLVSAPELKAFFSIEDIKLPPWSDRMCMAAYLPNLEEMLKHKFIEASASIGARRRFIEALGEVFGRPIEADPTFCRRVTLLCCVGIFTFLVHFSIPLQFPNEKPSITLQSSQHFNSAGTPIKSPPLDDYPWSPRWGAIEMANRIFKLLADECRKFKQYCTDSFPQQL